MQGVAKEMAMQFIDAAQEFDMLAYARRLRAHEVMQRERHEVALQNLEQAAGHCARAGGGGLTNLDAVADFIRSEIAGNFRFDEEVKDDPASWASRAAAGLLLLGACIYSWYNSAK